MAARITLYGHLKHYSAGSYAVIDVPAGTAISRILEDLEIPDDEVLGFFKNGARCDDSYRVADNDALDALPAISGG